jgi:hypothetical protein
MRCNELMIETTLGIKRTFRVSRSQVECLRVRVNLVNRIRRPGGEVPYV